MNTHLQSAAAPAHLDADQLNAFAEGALAAHERDAALAHLAGCAACREVAFLSLQDAAPDLAAVPAAAHVAAPPAAPARTVAATRTPWWQRWFTSGPLAGALTAGLACAIALLVVVHQRSATVPTAQPQQTAQLDAAPPRTKPEVAAVAPAEEAAPLPRAQRKAAPPKMMNVAPPAMTNAAPPAVVNAAPPPPRSASSGAVLAEAQPVVVPQAAVHGALAFNTAQNGNGSGSAPAGARGGPRLAQNQQFAYAAPASQAAAPAAASASGAASGAAIYSARATAPAAPPPPPPPVQRPNATSADITTVDAAAAAAPIQPLGSPLPTLRARDRAQPQVLTEPLPSGELPVSTAISGGRLIAVDARGNVYLSQNGGRDWQGVEPVWLGKALHVAIAQPAHTTAVRGYAAAQTSTQPSAPTSTTLSDDASPPADEARKVRLDKTTADALPPFTLTTDTGGVWSSTDGLNWHVR